jgi:hypothetical protein
MGRFKMQGLELPVQVLPRSLNRFILISQAVIAILISGTSYGASFNFRWGHGL